MKKIEVFDIVRTIAFFMVFISHSGTKFFENEYGFGLAGVSIFIVLSGFLIAYNHCKLGGGILYLR